MRIRLFFIFSILFSLRLDAASEIRVPVLCYHSIADRQPGAFTISTGVFEQQMQYLYTHGYTVITLKQLVRYLRLRKAGHAGRVKLPRKSVVITFDDNYVSIPLNALPILRLYGFPATNFLYTKFMTPKQWVWRRRFAAKGLDFQSHTLNHVDLIRRKPGESLKLYKRRIYKEMNDSRKVIAAGLKKTVVFLAYPFGTSNPIVRRLARLSGYMAMFSALGGYVTAKSKIDNLPRFTMFRNFDMEAFKLIVSGAWNRGYGIYDRVKQDFKPRDYNFDFGK